MIPTINLKIIRYIKGLILRLLTLKFVKKIETTNDPIYLIFDLKKLAKAHHQLKGLLLSTLLKRFRGGAYETFKNTKLNTH